MFAFLVGAGFGYLACYVKNRFGVALKVKLQKVERDVENTLRDQ